MSELTKITQAEFDATYDSHQLWLQGNGGRPAIFQNVNFSDIKMTWRGDRHDYRAMTFERCSLRGSRFYGHLNGAHFEKCDLTNAHFYADMEATAFTNCILHKTEFSRCGVGVFPIPSTDQTLIITPSSADAGPNIQIGTHQILWGQLSRFTEAMPDTWRKVAEWRGVIDFIILKLSVERSTDHAESMIPEGGLVPLGDIAMRITNFPLSERHN